MNNSILKITDDLLQYPMLKLAKEIDTIYDVKLTPFYNRLNGLLEGYHCRFLNGVILSVQFSPYHYCDNYLKDDIDYLTFKTVNKFENLSTNSAEIAIIVNGSLIDLGSDTVAGYQTYNEILHWASEAASINLPK